MYYISFKCRVTWPSIMSKVVYYIVEKIQFFPIHNVNNGEEKNNALLFNKPKEITTYFFIYPIFRDHYFPWNR